MSTGVGGSIGLQLAKTFGVPLLQGILGGFMSSGDRAASRDAMEQQMNLATQLVNMMTRQDAQVDPLRQQVFSQLMQRGQQGFPNVRPMQPQAFNPLANRNRIQPGAAQFRGGGQGGRGIASPILEALQSAGVGGASMPGSGRNQAG